MNQNTTLDLMTKIISLCKRRGFVFQSSEVYGGLKSSYDYGPLGAELKRNISNQWWRSMVYQRDDIVGMDANIFMHPKVWETSGHLTGFSDPLVDCLNCKERFRADKAPRAEVNSNVQFHEGGKKSGKTLTGKVGERGYVCPQCGSPNLSNERQFNLMFRTSLGPIDPMGEFLAKNYEKNLPPDQFRAELEQFLKGSAVYLRPETAQAMFVQFLNVQQSMSMKVPFGIAQIGKAFRNEIIVEHFIFRSCEFEQMELEFFVEPGTEKHWLDYWKNERLNWYLQFVNDKSKFRLRAHEDDELAHYSDACYDIEYAYPWGWGELEGIASRTDYDLSRHAEATGQKLSYFDQTKNDPTTNKPGWRYTPYVIEPSAGLTRSLLVFLVDAYCEEQGERPRVVLKLDPRLAPIKVAVLPLVKKDGQPEIAEKIHNQFKKDGIYASLDDGGSIGKRYARHDEIGTPFCLTIDNESIASESVTIRYRDTMEQKRLKIDEAVQFVKTGIGHV